MTKTHIITGLQVPGVYICEPSACDGKFLFTYKINNNPRSQSADGRGFESLLQTLFCVLEVTDLWSTEAAEIERKHWCVISSMFVLVQEGSCCNTQQNQLKEERGIRFNIPCSKCSCFSHSTATAGQVLDFDPNLGFTFIDLFQINSFA